MIEEEEKSGYKRKTIEELIDRIDAKEQEKEYELLNQNKKKEKTKRD